MGSHKLSQLFFLGFEGRCLLNKRINLKATNCNIGCNKCRDPPTICSWVKAAAEAATLIENEG